MLSPLHDSRVATKKGWPDEEAVPGGEEGGRERERETMRACPAPQVSKICEEARDAAERLQQRQ